MRGGKGAPAVQRPPRPPPPVRVRRSPARRRRGGRDWARSEVGRDLEKPPRLHCSGRGRPEEPVPQSRHPAGRSRSEVPRCLDLPGPGGSAWRGREALLRGGPRPADQALATTARRVNARRPTVAEKVVTAAREVLRRQSSVASDVVVKEITFTTRWTNPTSLKVHVSVPQRKQHFYKAAAMLHVPIQQNLLKFPARLTFHLVCTPSKAG
ncbi:uncharacterized protein LOC125098548 isoform X2 [Lutra lutra]|uniref:uncharacterized protein LOC125098548 isoform X2 n=1 Tax=Lutra lutra TaxID=9657 RepID=UPI001FD2ADF8|nr:uncharacterized protein LOC125098548 isoform X2 [Lutra lutra]